VRVLSALAGRTDEFPEHRSNDAAVGYNWTPSVFLSAEDASMLPMRWYARPEGDSTLEVEPRLASWNKADHPDQVRLQAYLDDAEVLLADSRIDGPWALRLDVGLGPVILLGSQRGVPGLGESQAGTQPGAGADLKTKSCSPRRCSGRMHLVDTVRIG
jgi:hypothetical protein